MKNPFTRSTPIILILVIGILVYSASLFNEFVWDSVPQIVNNPDVVSFNLKRIFTSSATFPGDLHSPNFYYKPMMYAVFAFVYLFFKENPFGYHAIQLLFHLANGVLILYLFRKYFSANLSLFLTLVFLVHPINFESVGYPSALQDTMFLFFGMSALSLISFAKVRTNLKYIAVALLLLLSLLSKETGVVFPCMLFLYIWLYKDRRQAFFFIPLVTLVSVVYFILRLISANDQYGFLNKSAIMTRPISDRIAAVSSIINYYVQTFFFPAHLRIDQQWTVSGFSVTNIAVFLLLIGISFVVAYKAVVSKREGHKENALIFFSSWLLAGLALHSHVFAPLDMTVADRWFYFPMIGLLGLLGLALTKIRMKYTVSLVLAVVILGLLSVRTFARSLVWSDKLTLYENDLKYDPKNYHLANKYAAELLWSNSFEEAEKVLRTAYAAKPDYGPLNSNLGYLYERKQDYLRARTFYQRAIDVGDFGDVNKTYDALARLELNVFHNYSRAKQLAEEGLKKYPNDRALKRDLKAAEFAL